MADFINKNVVTAIVHSRVNNVHEIIETRMEISPLGAIGKKNYIVKYTDTSGVVQRMHINEYDYNQKLLALQKINSIPLVRKGYVQAMSGNELWVNTTTDEVIKIVVKDKTTRWDLYCKHVKVTVEVIDESEI